MVESSGIGKLTIVPNSRTFYHPNPSSKLQEQISDCYTQREGEIRMGTVTL
jgi:hypothetical protein